MSRQSAGEVIRTNGHAVSSGLKRQLTTPRSTAMTENPTGPSSIWPVERVAAKMGRVGVHEHDTSQIGSLRRREFTLQPRDLSGPKSEIGAAGPSGYDVEEQTAMTG